MNAMSLSAPRPLLDVLGARWKLGVPVLGVAWDNHHGLAGFGLGDGSLALAPSQWEGAAELKARDADGVELVPATKAAPPVARIPVHAGACLGVAADPDGGFLTGGDDGQLARVQPDGVIETLAWHQGVWASPLAAGRGGWRAYASGCVLRRVGAAAREVALVAPAETLAIAPDGSRVAAGHSGGVTLWAGGDTPRVLAAGGTHRAVAWSPDTRCIASATREGSLHLWSVADGRALKVTDEIAAVRALGFTAGGWLIAAGTERLAAFGRGERDELLGQTDCGVAGRSPVARISCHPNRDLVASGYVNGVVLLCRPGSREVLFVRVAGGGPISALAWSPEGAALAIGTEAGEIGVVRLPALLFRSRGAALP